MRSILQRFIRRVQVRMWCLDGAPLDVVRILIATGLVAGALSPLSAESIAVPAGHTTAPDAASPDGASPDGASPEALRVADLVGAAAVVDTAVLVDTTEGAERVAAAYFDAFQARDWPRCASLMHPAALQQLKDVLVQAVADDSSSGIPDALYGRGAPREVIRVAPPEELYAKMLATVYRNAPEATDVLDRLSTQILGHVTEHDSLVHVVARTSVAMRSPPGDDPSGDGRPGTNRPVPGPTAMPASGPPSALTQVEVVSVRRMGDAWRLQLTADIRDIARAVRRPPER